MSPPLVVKVMNAFSVSIVKDSSSAWFSSITWIENFSSSKVFSFNSSEFLFSVEISEFSVFSIDVDESWFEFFGEVKDWKTKAPITTNVESITAKIVFLFI